MGTLIVSSGNKHLKQETVLSGVFIHDFIILRNWEIDIVLKIKILYVENKNTSSWVFSLRNNGISFEPSTNAIVLFCNYEAKSEAARYNDFALSILSCLHPLRLV